MKHSPQKNTPAMGTNTDAASQARSNWIVIPRTIFEQIAETYGITQDFIMEIVAEGDINPDNDDAIILTDGRFFGKWLMGGFTTNASLDLALEGALETPLSSSNPGIATVFRTHIIKILLRDTLRLRLAKNLPRQARKLISRALSSFEEERANQHNSKKDALTESEERMFWEFLDEANRLLSNSGKNVFSLFKKGKLDSLMRGSPLLAQYQSLAKQKQESAQAQILALTGGKSKRMKRS